MDYGGPTGFEPTRDKRGAGEHPHRGFETVTIVYDDEVEYRDSAGGGGIIGPGDVQWMIAASGLVHEEFHGPKFAKAEGPFERVQLWVNLPAHDKMSPPRYQGIIDTSIPRIPLPGHSGFRAGYTAEFHVPEGYTTCLFVLKGQVRLPESAIVGEAELAVLEATGTKLALEALEDSTHLLLNGKPLHEPIVGHEPFVMNTQSQIRQAFIDYQSGRMGHLK